MVINCREKKRGCWDPHCIEWVISQK